MTYKNAERTRSLANALLSARVSPPHPAFAPHARTDTPHTDAQPVATRTSAVYLPRGHTARIPLWCPSRGPWWPAARRSVVLLHCHTLAGAPAWTGAAGG